MFESKKSRMEIGKIVNLWSNIKGTILYCEEIYPERKTNIAILLELRNALDHLIRAIIAEAKSKKENSDISSRI